MAQTITVLPAQYIANFHTEYLLTSNVSPAAGGSITAGGWFGVGTVQSIGASANAGYQFAGFSGDLTGLTSPQNLTMNAPKNVVANYSTLAPILNGSISSRSGVAAVTAVDADTDQQRSGRRQWGPNHRSGADANRGSGLFALVRDHQPRAAAIAGESAVSWERGDVLVWYGGGDAQFRRMCPVRTLQRGD